MQHASQGQAPELDGHKMVIGIVRARFNDPITQSLLDACTTELRALGVKDNNIHIVDVPGALEVPVALQAMAQNDRFDALVALGCIIRGETYHFELVANESGAGVSLTVHSVQDDAQHCALPINLIPNTVENTALGQLKAGQSVNLEIDLIARYVERMLNSAPAL